VETRENALGCSFYGLAGVEVISGRAGTPDRAFLSDAFQNDRSGERKLCKKPRAHWPLFEQRCYDIHVSDPVLIPREAVR